MAIKADDKKKVAKFVEERGAEIDAVAKKKEDEAKGTVPQQLSRQAQALDTFAAVAMAAAKACKEMRSTIIMAENRSNSLSHDIREADKRLAATERKANLALQQSTSGTRALADRLAISQGKLIDKETQLAARERTIAVKAQEAEELKAMYESQLAALSKIPALKGE